MCKLTNSHQITLSMTTLLYFGLFITLWKVQLSLNSFRVWHCRVVPHFYEYVKLFAYWELDEMLDMTLISLRAGGDWKRHLGQLWLSRYGRSSTNPKVGAWRLQSACRKVLGVDAEPLDAPDAHVNVWKGQQQIIALHEWVNVAFSVKLLKIYLYCPKSVICIVLCHQIIQFCVVEQVSFKIVTVRRSGSVIKYSVWKCSSEALRGRQTSLQ